MFNWNPAYAGLIVIMREIKLVYYVCYVCKRPHFLGGVIFVGLCMFVDIICNLFITQIKIISLECSVCFVGSWLENQRLCD